MNRRAGGFTLAVLLIFGCAERQDVARPGAAEADVQPDTPAQVPAPPTITYAPPSQDSLVSWAELTAMIRARPDSLRTVMQTHARKVTATFLDGRRVHATEPSIDAIVTLLRQVDPAGHVLIATE